MPRKTNSAKAAPVSSAWNLPTFSLRRKWVSETKSDGSRPSASYLRHPRAEQGAQRRGADPRIHAVTWRQYVGDAEWSTHSPARSTNFGRTAWILGSSPRMTKARNGAANRDSTASRPSPPRPAKQLEPFQVGLLNQLDLPLSRPALQRLLALDGIADVEMLLIPDQPLHTVAR